MYACVQCLLASYHELNMLFYFYIIIIVMIIPQSYGSLGWTPAWWLLPGATWTMVADSQCVVPFDVGKL